MKSILSRTFPPNASPSLLNSLNSLSMDPLLLMYETTFLT